MTGTSADAAEARGLDGVPRVLGDAGDPNAGPTLICIGGLHGNEPSGVHALRRVFATLAADPTGLEGRVLGLAGNRGALEACRRFQDHDLNRAWTRERLEQVRAANGPLETEDEELRELDAALRDAVESSAEPPAILDLHSTSGGGPAFVTLDDTLPIRELALEIPAPHVLGLEEELEGTLPAHLIEAGLVAFGFESGQHLDPASVDRAEAAVWIVMEATGVLARHSRPEVARSRAVLDNASNGLPAVVEVLYRHPVHPGDEFVHRPGYRSFQRVRAGERLANDGDDLIRAPLGGLILMPLYQAQGEDGFFITRPVRPFWLRVSAALRRLRFERYVHWLPGVRRHEETPGHFVVDRRVARWFALEVFHLLGFRREETTKKGFVVSPRGRQR